MHCAPRTRSVGQRPRRGSQQILLTRANNIGSAAIKQTAEGRGLKEPKHPSTVTKRASWKVRGACDTAATGRTRKGLARSEDCRHNARCLGGMGKKEGANCGACARPPCQARRRKLFCAESGCEARSSTDRTAEAATGLRAYRPAPTGNEPARGTRDHGMAPGKTIAGR
ncbi:hypothetical protein ERJ75_000565000 [Trypanosoma vivax]|nr:hypothetical protein ERJ75_000565000 [Trypanosoma vivax]